MVGSKYAEAIKQAGVQRIVNLSSVGADLPEGTGPIAGLYDVEQKLNKLEGPSVKHIRAGFFYLNFLGNIDMIRNMNIIGSNYGADTVMPLVHPDDIAEAAAQELQNGFTGKSVRYAVSDVRTAKEIASVLGAAIGKPELPWVEFSDQQSLEGMEKAGMPVSIAKTFTEMGSAVRKGMLMEDYKRANMPITGTIKLEDFAVQFAGQY